MIDNSSLVNIFLNSLDFHSMILSEIGIQINGILSKSMDFIETAAVYFLFKLQIHKYSELTANETKPFVFVQNVMNKHALNLYTISGR